MKTAVQIFLALAMVFLGYMIFESIMKPIRFNKAKDYRYSVAIQRLKDIRTAQVAYRSAYGKYTGSFDTLVDFLKNDQFKVVRKIGELSDSLLEAGWNEKMGIKAGILKRDTTKISVLDSLFGVNYQVDSIPIIPFTNGEKFELGAGWLETGSKVKVPVFEAKVENNLLLKGLDEQLIINFNDERNTKVGYPGLKLGSLTEATNNAGNWE